MNRSARSTPRTRRRIASAARGYTLLESMIASVLLAACTVGVSGAIAASYQHDQQIVDRQAALLAGRQLIDEVAALPMSASTSGQASMTDYDNYTDSATTASSDSVIASRVAPSSSTTSTGTSATSTSSSPSLLGSVVTSVTGVVSSILGTSSSTSSTGSTSGTPPASTATSTPVSTTSTTVSQVTRAMTVTRMATANGTASATGDFALLRMKVTNRDGSTTTLSRLVSSAEANANQASQ